MTEPSQRTKWDNPHRALLMAHAGSIECLLLIRKPYTAPCRSHDDLSFLKPLSVLPPLPGTKAIWTEELALLQSSIHLTPERRERADPLGNQSTADTFSTWSIPFPRESKCNNLMISSSFSRVRDRKFRGLFFFFLMCTSLESSAANRAAFQVLVLHSVTWHWGLTIA